MGERTFNVLFLCTGNSARSILAEVLLNEHGRGRFRAFSAGSFPKGEVHPMALRTLKKAGLPTEGLRSKSWDEFATEDAPELDFIFTVCDNAANETCPVWPGHPMTAHWGVEDPANAPEGEQKAAFQRAMFYLNNRISLFLALPLESIDEMTLGKRLQEIGKTKDAEPTLA
ncbi:arsenate reductase ArsC [Sphingomonas sp.]|uniref:arsenate reductase ArsC n=1 Tax=Sphingomonas sp. TaxID=28214 RepID=UPI0018430B94|nr:arsenate reductase ArsC [Sphingomonas sp.]MBA3511217.1 arsenate reductase ArsC [Sphingomonas sp.]